MEELKRSILQLDATIASAKDRKKEAEAEAAKLEKDMKEFGQNKESKLKELKVSCPAYSHSRLQGAEATAWLVGGHREEAVRRRQEERQV